MKNENSIVNTQKNTWITDLFWLVLYTAILFGFMLGARALSVPDEARYTEIPREMWWFHDFVTPHLDGIKYFEKPPLLYWIQASIFPFFGINEWALRAPTALMGILGGVAVYSATRFLFDRIAALAAALILATSPLYFVMAHSITLDMLVSLWITISLLAFIVAVNLPTTSMKRSGVLVVMYAAMAFAILSKGLIGILLPGAVIVSWIVLTHHWRLIPTLHIFLGLVIVLAISLPWHILVQLRNPEFFHFYFVDQQFLRFLTKSAGRYQPMWWFIPVLIAGFFPWVIFAGIAIIRKVFVRSITAATNKNVQHKHLFFLLWASEIFLFFSISQSKLIPYILPIMPPLAILLASACRHQTLGLFDKKSSVMMAGVWIVLSVGFWVASFRLHEFSSFALAHIRGLATIWFISGIGLLAISEQEARKLRFMWVILMQSVFLWGVVITAPQFDERPIKSLVLHLKHIIQPTDVVASYGLYYQDLPVYLQRLVLIVNWKNELSFGYDHQSDAKERLLTQEAFWPIWDGQKRVFAIMDDSDFEKQRTHHHFHIIARHDDDLLVENH